jgi:hypothetical protein
MDVDGDGTFSEQRRYDAGRSPFAVAVHDLDGHELLDLVRTLPGRGKYLR